MKRLFLLFALCSSLAAASQPNVPVIFADDLGCADIDALAASGVRCANGYVTAPCCSSSRAGLLTGKSQTRFGHEFNPYCEDEAKSQSGRELYDLEADIGEAHNLVAEKPNLTPVSTLNTPPSP